MKACPLLLVWIALLTTGDSSQWQTVFPDTQVIIPLFGDGGPSWTLHSTDGVYTNIPAKIPGDVLSDLLRSDLIDDPYFERNFLTQRRTWMGPLAYYDNNSTLKLERRTRAWTYTTEFELDHNEDDSTSYTLVLEGVKMGATVAVNGVALGNVTSQFLRFTHELTNEVLAHGGRESSILRRRELSSNNNIVHQLSVTFDPTISTNGRFMACSGGWDWAPYSKAGDERGSRVFTFGIFKPIYIVKERHASITQVVPKVYYLGPYARKPMLDGPAGDFRVDVDVHLEYRNHPARSGIIIVRSNFQRNCAVSETSTKIQPWSNVVTVSLMASKDQVELWWPNGLGGEQRLYNVEVALRIGDLQTDWIHKRIGFRTCALVTVNDTDDSLVNDIIHNKSEGSGLHGMFLRVNGAAIWSRGANVVPMDQLEGRHTDEAHRTMVQSAAQANMNMLRVWGGGMVLPDSFYDACDEFGILLYHDMMFVEEHFHGPQQTNVIEDEIRFMVRQLSSHPSIVLWSGCNECTVVMNTTTEIYATFVMQTVAEEDDTRIIWPSCPAKVGWKTGVYTIDGRPNGRSLSTMSVMKGQAPLEVHGPYQRGFSWTYPSVNGYQNNWTYITNIPPVLGVDPVSIAFRNHFVSEFGASVFPSFESLSARLSPFHWSIHGGSPPDTCQHVAGNDDTCNGTNVMAERNYACDSHILAFFGDETNLEKIGRKAFRQQLHHCAMAHVLWMKGQIEVLRSANSFGSLVWQLNENWPTGGWGLLEYGSKSGLKGQVVGGRWTALMYLLRNALYRDVLSTCGIMKSGDYACYCRNDGISRLRGSLRTESLNLATGALELLAIHHLDVKEGSLTWFDTPKRAPQDDEVYLLTVLDAHSSTLIDDYVVLGREPKNMNALSQKVAVNVVSVEEDDTGNGLVTLRSDGVALYVVLTTLAEGNFDDNAFLLKPHADPKIVKFVPATPPLDIDLLNRSLTIEHLGSYS